MDDLAEIRKRIIKQGIQQSQVKTIVNLAEKVGTSNSYLHAYLSGERRWNEQILTKIAEITGIKLEYLFIPTKEKLFFNIIKDAFLSIDEKNIFASKEDLTLVSDEKSYCFDFSLFFTNVPCKVYIDIFYCDNNDPDDYSVAMCKRNYNDFFLELNEKEPVLIWMIVIENNDINIFSVPEDYLAREQYKGMYPLNIFKDKLKQFLLPIIQKD